MKPRHEMAEYLDLSVRARSVSEEVDNPSLMLPARIDVLTVAVERPEYCQRVIPQR